MSLGLVAISILVWQVKPKKKHCKFLNPKPPPALGSHIFSHDTHEIFFSSDFWPHQKFLIIFVKSSHSDSEILKQLIVYFGTTKATTLMRIFLPAFDNNFSFHPANFLPSFSLMSLKVFCFFFPTSDGKPRYFSCCFMT